MKTATAMINLEGLKILRSTGEPDFEYYYHISFDNCSEKFDKFYEIRAGFTKEEALCKRSYLSKALEISGIQDQSKVIVVFDSKNDDKVIYIRGINSDFWIDLKTLKISNQLNLDKIN